MRSYPQHPCLVRFSGEQTGTLTGMSTPDTPGGPEELERLSSSTSTSVLERTETEKAPSPGDGERFAHYVKKEKITAATIEGTPVIALCGKVWVPSRDPKRFPVCPACKEIYEGLQNPGDDGAGKGRGRFGFGSKK